MLALSLLASALAAPPPSPLLSLVPFGVGVYVYGKPGRGVAYSVTQAAGLGVLTYATIRTEQAAEAEDAAAYELWENVGIAAAAATVASYGASVIDASRLYEVRYGDGARASVEAWDRARARGEALAAGEERR